MLRVPRGLAVDVRPADTDAEAWEVGAADGAGDGAQAVVAAVAALRLEAQAAGGEVEVIVDDNEVFGWDFDVAEGGARRPGRWR